MKVDEVPYVIVQAGGRGSRMEQLTANKPKCLLSVAGEPLLYRLFRQLPGAHFIIVADYLSDVLKNYLETVPPEVNHAVVLAEGKGTMSGLSTALSMIDETSSFLIVWCDLFFDHFPSDDFGDRLLVCLSDQFNCRWSLDDNGKLADVPSSNRGVAGLFAVPSKKCLGNLPANGEFVRHLQRSSISIETLVVPGMHEFGSLAAFRQYEEQHAGHSARYFNRVDMRDREVVKTARLRQYGHLLEAEARWYETVNAFGFENAPRLYSHSPLTIERIDGTHPFALDLSPDDRAGVVTRIIDCLDQLHGLGAAPQDLESDRIVYHEKTMSRMSSVRRLLPNVDSPTLIINGRTCRNPLHPRYADWFGATIASLAAVNHTVIHGDPTFSNILVDNAGRIWLIDPRGTFGRAECFGDPRYDWAKLLYSVQGNYDQFNRRKFHLTVSGRVVALDIESSGWEKHSSIIRERIDGHSVEVDVIHSLIWLSLTGYALDDVDSVMGAFYRGALLLEESTA